MTASTTARRPSWELLGLMRFLLAAVVVSVHIRWFQAAPVPWAVALNEFGGKAAVIGFLLISGFSIAASQQRRAEFYLRRRLLRIYPLYLFAILFACALEYSLGTVTVPGSTFEARGAWTMLGNLLLLQTFVVKPLAFDGPVWSLSIEFAFYIGAIAFVRMRPRYLWALVGMSIICFLLPRRDDLGLVYFFFSKLNALRYLWCWLLGYLFWTHRTNAYQWLLVSGVGLVYFFQDSPESLSIVTYLVVVGALCFSDLIKVSGPAAKLLDMLGDLSYPLYLVHLPSFIFAYFYLGVRSPALLVAFAAAVTCVSYVCIERILKPRYLMGFVTRERAALRSEVGHAAE